jgi:mannosyltransferase OCH1-like enzyme
MYSLKYRLRILILLAILLFLLFITIYFFKTNIYESFEESVDYLDGIDVIYWINLDRSTDRREHMEKMFLDPVFNGKTIIRIQAVDGKAPDIDNILNNYFQNMNPELKKTEYAGTLSHINAIRQFYESNYKIALILEDDTCLDYKPYWNKTLKHIMEEAPQDWDIIQLEYLLSWDRKINIPNEMFIKNGDGAYCSSGAYIINKNNVIHVINDRFIQRPIDVYLFDVLNTYIYKYPYFTCITNTNSTIHQDHVEYHDWSKETIFKWLNSIFLHINSNSIIPLHIYQTWHTKNLPPLMKDCVNRLINMNPEFKHHLYDENECREFIKNNYDERVLYAYDSLIPAAYKSDLWRYCILYEYGGVYLDIKFECVNDFKLYDIVKNGEEIFVKEYEKYGWDYVNNNPIISNHVVCNGFMVAKPKNHIFLNMIYKICENVESKFYGSIPTHPTGPRLFWEYFTPHEFNNIKYVYFEVDKVGYIREINTGKYILKFYDEYREEQEKYKNKKSYRELWYERKMYRE